nr:endonuclease domain-containing protein [Caulobacter mirabilis]
MTLPEGLLWRAIRAHRLEGIHFRRQHPIGPYVLDFYCDAARLAIEVDGAMHYIEGRPERDAARDNWLSQRGIRTLRLPARVVLKDMNRALMTILAAIGERAPTKVALPLGELSARSDD